MRRTNGIHSKFIQSSGLALLIAVSAARLPADTLPLGITSAIAEVDSFTGTRCVQGDVNSASCSLGGSTANALVANGHGGSDQVTLGNNATVGSALTSYYIGLVGPPGFNVPIIINGVADTHDAGAGFSASYAVYNILEASLAGSVNLAQYFASPNGCAVFSANGMTCQSTGNFSLNTSITSGSVFYVQMQALAYGTNASASIDPTITINPSFAQASQFTLVSNLGVFASPSSAAPEPATTALFAIAALAAGLGLKIKRTGASN